MTNSGSFKDILFEYLRTNVAVEAHQLYMRLNKSKFDDLHCLTCFDGSTELGVNFTGCNSLISMRINARSEAEEKLLTEIRDLLKERK